MNFDFMIGSLLGIPTGAILVLLWFVWVERDTPKGNDEEVPEFQQTLITLSKIPGLEIKGEGIHIKGTDLKGEDKT